MAALKEMIPNVSAAGILNGMIWFLVGILVVGIVGVLTWYFVQKRKYRDFRVEIFDKDANGNVYKKLDRGGIFLDKKSGYKLLWLEKAKAGLDPNDPPYVSHLDKRGRLIRTVYVRKDGEGNYRYISITLGEKISASVKEEDLNNAHQEMSKIRRTYDKKSWLDKYGAIATWVIVIVCSMILVLSIFNKFTVMKEISENTLRVTELQTQITGQLLNLTNMTQRQEAGYEGIIRPTGT